MGGVDEEENIEFRWGKKRGIGGKKKDVRFFESFHYDNVQYKLFDCVYLYKDGEPEPFIGKIIKIWENSDKTRRVKVLWFFRPCEILNYLGAEVPLPNELFLASGEGVGLANVNPLEAIAGKCNIVCISKDERNPQPADEQVKLADFVFYRTFDVGLCKISDKINEKIAGFEVRFILNGEDLCKYDGVAIDSDINKVSGIAIPRADGVEIDSGKNKVSGNAVSSAEILSKNDPSEEHITLRTPDSWTKDASEECRPLRTKDSLSKEKSTLGENNCSTVHAESSEIDEIKNSQARISSEKTNLKFKFKDSADMNSLTKEKSALGEKFCSGVYNEVGDENKVKSSMNSDILECAPSKRPKLGNPLNVFEEKNENRVEMHGHGSNVKALTKIAPISKDKSKSTLLKTENGSFNRMKVEEMPLGQCDGDLQKGTSPKEHLEEENTMVPRGATTYQITEIENRPSKRPKLDEKHDGKLPKASNKQPWDEENTIDHQVVEVNRRPGADRRNWFKELPWEERMQAAHEQGTLVLLENLDPAYTSLEVEDIVWHGFNISCAAKMIQQTAYSSPHYGQALVIFKTKDAAQTVVSKLDKGCLLLSNERPLVGRFVSPSFLGVQSSFIGHLVIDKLRPQMQREMKEAVSTSHCSQPNTLEYDMAIEWCLLQERWDCTWKKMHQQQGEELEELKLNLRLK